MARLGFTAASLATSVFFVGYDWRRPAVVAFCLAVARQKITQPLRRCGGRTAIGSLCERRGGCGRRGQGAGWRRVGVRVDRAPVAEAADQPRLSVLPRSRPRRGYGAGGVPPRVSLARELAARRSVLDVALRAGHESLSIRDQTPAAFDGAVG